MLYRVRRAGSCRAQGVLAPLSVRSVVGAVLAHGSAFRRHRSIRPGEGVESSVARDGRHRVRSAWSRKANEVGTGGRRGCGPRTHGVLPRRTRVTEYPPVVHRVCGQAPSSVDDAVTRMWTDGVMGDRSHRVVGHVERLVAVWHPARSRVRRSDELAGAPCDARLSIARHAPWVFGATGTRTGPSSISHASYGHFLAGPSLARGEQRPAPTRVPRGTASGQPIDASGETRGTRTAVLVSDGRQARAERIIEG